MTTKNEHLIATGHYILVKPMAVKEKTSGGIILADISKDAEHMNISCGQVIHIGKGAYKNKDSGKYWASGPWCEVGQWVICPKFGTKKITIDGDAYTLLNDDEVMGVIDDPRRLKAYV